MEFLENFSVNFEWLYISAGLLFLIIILLLVKSKYKPSFVVPDMWIDKFKFYFEKLIIFLIIFLILLLPLNLTLHGERKIQTERTTNVQLLFQVSLSMTIDDVDPSRFQVARDAMYDFVDNLRGYNVWVVIYSGLPFNWIPLSNEIDAILSKINNLNLSEFPPTLEFVGTWTGDWIFLAVDNFIQLWEEQGEQTPSVIVLFSDGDINIGHEPVQAAEYASRHDIPIYWITVGETDQEVGTDMIWSPVVGTFNFDKVRQISQATWWEAYHVMSERQLQEAFQDIEENIETYEKEYVYQEKTNLNQYFYIILSVLLTIFFGVRVYIYTNANT